MIAADVQFLDAPGTKGVDLPAEDRNDARENDELDIPL